MKVFNLSCAHDHRFEGWFGSADDFDVQLRDGLLECPICGSREIRKLPSAPRLNLSGASSDASGRAVQAESPAGVTPTPNPGQVQEMMMRVARFLVQNTEDVGDRFAEEARRIHYRETTERGIRGIATQDEARALGEEGIDVFAFPIPAHVKEPLQ